MNGSDLGVNPFCFACRVLNLRGNRSEANENPPMIRNYLFDIGNVILKFDFGLAASRIADASEVEEAEIIPLLTPMHVDLETGKLPPEAFLENAAEATGYAGALADLRHAFQDIFTLNQPIADWIASLDEEGHPLFLLSNTSDLHVSWFTKEYAAVFDRFQGAIYSHETGCMKPDPQIYDQAIKQLAIDPAETLYLDDLPANVDAANAAGFRALVYEHADHPGFRSKVAPLLQSRVISD